MIKSICHLAPGRAVYLPWMNERQKEAELLRGTECALQNLGVPTHFKGYHYLVAAIMIAADTPNRLNDRYTRFYSDVAAVYGEKYGSVEKCIRTVIDKTFDNYNHSRLYDYFGDLIKEKSGKITNLDFIRRVSEDVRADIMSNSLGETRKRLLAELGLKSEVPE